MIKKDFIDPLNALSCNFEEKNKCFYFVIFKGREMGNYLTWQEAASHIEGFPNPSFKGFYSFQEAE